MPPPQLMRSDSDVRGAARSGGHPIIERRADTDGSNVKEGEVSLTGPIELPGNDEATIYAYAEDQGISEEKTFRVAGQDGEKILKKDEKAKLLKEIRGETIAKSFKILEAADANKATFEAAAITIGAVTTNIAIRVGSDVMLTAAAARDLIGSARKAIGDEDSDVKIVAKRSTSRPASGSSNSPSRWGRTWRVRRSISHERHRQRPHPRFRRPGRHRSAPLHCPDRRPLVGMFTVLPAGLVGGDVGLGALLEGDGLSRFDGPGLLLLEALLQRIEVLEPHDPADLGLVARPRRATRYETGQGPYPAACRQCDTGKSSSWNCRDGPSDKAQAHRHTFPGSDPLDLERGEHPYASHFETSTTCPGPYRERGSVDERRSCGLGRRRA